VYESDDFYDRCDELGILTWQDFLLACAAYAEEEPLRGEVVAEAREAVTRLAAHPSLVLWNGGNENIWGYFDWGWRQRLDGRSWGLGYYLDILPAIVAELDPTRPYIAGSPWSLTPARHPNDPDHGSVHIWDVWNRRDYSAYRDHAPRFVAEFGFQGPPCWATLRRAVHDQPLTPTSPGMTAHQKAEDGAGKLERGLAGHFPPPLGVEDWHWATSLNQARAVAFGIERFRSLSPRCMGTVVWQLNDCWPVISWSTVDGDGRPKPLWYALRRSYADRLLTFQPRGGRVALVAVNDTDAPWPGLVEVARRSFDGTVLDRSELRLDAGPRATATLDLPARLVTAGDPSAELLVAETASARALSFYREDKDLAFPAPELDATCERTSGGYQVRLTARSLVRDVALLADKVAPDAVADDLLVTLLPGESASFLVRTTATIDPGALLHPMVPRSANQLLMG
jgi:beta-mannosidase